MALFHSFHNNYAMNVILGCLLYGDQFIEILLSIVHFFVYGKLSNMYANALTSQATQKGKIIIISNISEYLLAQLSGQCW